MIENIVVAMIVLGAISWLTVRVFKTVRSATGINAEQSGGCGSCGSCSRSPVNTNQPAVVQIGRGALKSR